jgi:competence ComEA-like helix-hairpin-helix protein
MRGIPHTLLSASIAGALAVLGPLSLAFATDRPAMKRDALTPSVVQNDQGGQGAKDPVRVRTAAPRAAANGARRDPNTVNINTATAKQLMTLAGVGRQVAERIIEYRDSRGPFKKADELRRVEGVTTTLWEKNRDRIVTK